MRYIVETNLDFDPTVLEVAIRKALSKRISVDVRVALLSTERAEKRVENNTNQSSNVL